MSADPTPPEEELHFTPDEALAHRTAQEQEKEAAAEELLRRVAAAQPEGEEKPQFSLLQMFGVMSLAAVGLASVTWFPSMLTAGLLGVAMLLVFLVTVVDAPDSRIARTICIVMLVLYLSAAAGALFLSFGAGE